MAFSQTDLDNIDAAMVTAAVSGYASVTVNGQTVASKTLDELRRLRDMVSGQLTSASNRPGLGLRFQQIKPVYS